MEGLLCLMIPISFLYGFVNGFGDGGNVLAAAVASRSMNPRTAFLLACSAELCAPLIVNTAVAATIGKGVVRQGILLQAAPAESMIAIAAAVTGAILWGLISWKLGLPSSSSHALIGGLIGSGMALFGAGAISWHVLMKNVIVVLLLTPVVGFFAAFVFIKLLMALLKRVDCSAAGWIKKAQFLGVLFLAGGHGAADSQKTMGIVTLLLLIAGKADQFQVPFWVKIVAAFSLSAGVLFGGWRIIRTVGTRIFKLEPMHSLSVQAVSTVVILVSAAAGCPVSTSQIVSSAIMGTGAGEKYKYVNWNVAGNILASWLLTIPASALVSAAVCCFLRYSMSAIIK